MSQWREVAVQDLCFRVTSGGTPSRKRADFYGQNGIPWVKSQELVEAKISATEEHITEAGLKGSSAKLLPPDTVLMAMYGANVGQLGWLGIEATVNQAVCAMVTDPEVTDARFLYYALAGARANLIAKAHGAAQQNLSQQLIKPFKLAVPDIATQRLVGGTLRSIDDLIENNRRRVEVLEEMARAIYREWFVKFRYPGHKDVPLVDSALGLIPDGWEETTLGEAARWFSGGTPKTTVAEYWNGDLPWITSGTLTSMLLDRSNRMLTELGAANGTRVVERDALLFVVRGMSLAKEFRVGIADGRLAFGQDVKALVASPGIDPMYLAMSVITRAEEIQRMVEFAGHGTGKISTDRLQALHVLRPPAELQRHFSETFRPLREMMTALRLAGDRVIRLRDELLPKLVTGQIDVSTLDLDVLVSTGSTDEGAVA